MLTNVPMVIMKILEMSAPDVPHHVTSVKEALQLAQNVSLVTISDQMIMLVIQIVYHIKLVTTTEMMLL